MNPSLPSKKLGCSGASSKADLIDVNRNSPQVNSLNHYGLVLMLVIVLLLLVDFRNIRKMILMIILPVIGVVWMRMGLTGLRITMLNIMAIPMIMGIGIDVGVHVIHRYQIEGNTAHNAVFSSTGRAVLLTSLTTMLYFGSFWSAVCRGLGSMGIDFYWRWPLFFRHCFCNLDTHGLGGATRSWKIEIRNLEMENRFIYLFMTLMCGIVFASTSKVEFNGMFSGLGQTVESDSNSVNINVRYIPLLEFEIAPQIDADLSGNIFTFFGSDNMNGIADSLEIKPYRAWIRYSTTRFEARIGLQKINFGPARILRSLMWFDQLDPKDPLQFTDGVYGLRLRYDFQNNANIWLWGLYGNDNPKGWEIFGTKENIPETGGRIQYPIGNAELAISAHHRSVQQEGIAENRIALDGFWDVGIGLWFESALVHAGFDEDKMDYRSFLTLGTDYTFAIGNGITATAEHLLMSIGNSPLDDNDRYNISALSVSYPFGMMDKLSFFCYYNWDSEIPFSFLSWQRTYDHWIIQFGGYWASEANTTSLTGEGTRTMGNRGLQFMTIFNY